MIVFSVKTEFWFCQFYNVLMSSIYKLNDIKLNYIYHAKEIIGNKNPELLEFAPMYSRDSFEPG